MTNLENGIQEATKYVLARGAVDQYEHMVGVDAEGKFLFCVDGEATSVSLEGVSQDLFNKTVALVHNHPNEEGTKIGGSLSLPDLMNATARGFQIYAVDEDGSVYSSTGFYRQKDSDIAKYNAIEGIVGTVTMMGIGLHQLEKTTSGLIAHIINLMCSKAGLYQYSYQLGPQTQALMEKNKDYIDVLLSKV